MKSKDKKQKKPYPRAIPKPQLPPITLAEAHLRPWREMVVALASRKSAFKPAPGLDYHQEVLRASRQEAATVRELWEAFTIDRRQLSKGLLGTKQFTLAYLLGFHLANICRMELLCERLTAVIPGWEKKLGASAKARAARIAIQDLGCGTGALALSLGLRLQNSGCDPTQLSINLSDIAAIPLGVAGQLVAQALPAVQVATHRKGIEQLPSAKLTGKDVFVYTMGYVWNELKRNLAGKRQLGKIFNGHISREESAMIILLEPASESQCLEAMTLRDELVEAGWIAVYPCPHSNPCPLTAEGKNWCYSEGHWQRPPEVRAMDELAGINREWFSGAMFAFVTPGLCKSSNLTVRGGPVVVGRPAARAAATDRNSKSARTSGNPSSNPKNFSYLVCDVDGIKKQSAKAGGPIIGRGVRITN